MPRSAPNLSLDAAIEEYLRRITNEGQAERTIHTARYALARFRRSFGRNNPMVHTIHAADLDRYCFGPDGIRRGIGAMHFNRQRSVLKVFFDYCLLMRWVDVNPMDGISRARPDAPKQRLLLNAGELLELPNRCSNPIERIAVAIGENTGLRANDVKHLTVFDASLASGTIQTEIRKTRKLDVKPITLELHRELERWLDLYAEYMGLSGRDQLPNDWLLVPSYRLPTPRERAQHVHPRPTQVMTHPWRLVQRPLARMGYPTKGEGFHTLRRSSARALFESLREAGEGRDHALMIVQEFLNHSSVVQTQHYIGLSYERTIRDAVLKGKSFLGALAETEQARVAQPVTVRRVG